MRRLLITLTGIAMLLAGAASAATASPSEAGLAPAHSAAAAEPAVDRHSVVPLHANCGTGGLNLHNGFNADAPRSGAVNQRSGSSTGCVAVGVLQSTDDAVYFCWTVGNDGFTWTYLRNVRTGVLGWSRDDLLDDNGSNQHCGF